MKTRFAPSTSAITFKKAGLLAALLAVSCPAAMAQTWVGGSVTNSNNWSDPDNWNTDVAPVSSSSTNVVLGLATVTTPVEDISDPFTLFTLKFAAGSTNTSLSGGALTFAGGPGQTITAYNDLGTFTDSVANNVTVSTTNGLVVSSGQKTDGSGNLNISGNIVTGTGGLNLQGYGTNSNLTGTIAGNAAGTTTANITSTSSGIWNIAPTTGVDNIGTVYIAGGEIKLGGTTANVLGTSAQLAFGTSAGTGGTLDLNGVSQSFTRFRNDNLVNNTVTNSSSTLSVFTDADTNFNNTVVTKITGNLEFDYTGTQAQTLGGVDTYTGATKIKSGEVFVNGTHTVASGTTAAYSVTGTGKLGGNGTINLSAVNQGITLASGTKLDPGSAAATVGTLTASLGTGVMDISAAVGGSNTGALIFNLNTVASSDMFNLTTGTLNIGTGVLDINDFAFTTSANFTQGTYTLFQTTNAITGSLSSTNLSETLGGYNSVLALSSNGQSIVLNVGAVPEPSVYGMLATGLALLVCVRLWLRNGSKTLV